VTRAIFILPELLTVARSELRDLQLPALSRLLSFAVQDTDPDFCPEQMLMRQLGYPVPAATALPVAQVCWQQEFQTAAPSACVCADPVHMLADTDHARLLDAHALQLTDDEAGALMAALNQHFAADNLQFVRAASGGWYAHGRDAAVLATLPTKVLVGRNVASFLPEGDASATWRRFTTEMQMLLFNHDVNQQRAAAGLLPVNALWLWGGAAMPTATTQQGVRVYADDPFSRGLAQLSQADVQHVSAFRVDDATAMVVDHGAVDALLYEDLDAWRTWLSALESRYFVPALAAWRRGELKEILIHVGNHRRFTIAGGGWRRWLRRRKSLAHFVNPQFAEPEVG